ncbi:MAG: lasso RiPP family leader peptide-containing protein [Egibacteraceae bacterium]
MHEAAYEPPMLAEVGDFYRLTRGYGSVEFDAYDYLSESFEEW